MHPPGSGIKLRPALSERDNPPFPFERGASRSLLSAHDVRTVNGATADITSDQIEDLLKGSSRKYVISHSPITDYNPYTTQSQAATTTVEREKKPRFKDKLPRRVEAHVRSTEEECTEHRGQSPHKRDSRLHIGPFAERGGYDNTQHTSAFARRFSNWIPSYAAANCQAKAEKANLFLKQWCVQNAVTGVQLPVPAHYASQTFSTATLGASAIQQCSEGDITIDTLPPHIDVPLPPQVEPLPDVGSSIAPAPQGEPPPDTDSDDHDSLTEEKIRSFASCPVDTRLLVSVVPSDEGVPHTATFRIPFVLSEYSVQPSAPEAVCDVPNVVDSSLADAVTLVSVSVAQPSDGGESTPLAAPSPVGRSLSVSHSATIAKALRDAVRLVCIDIETPNTPTSNIGKHALIRALRMRAQRKALQSQQSSPVVQKGRPPKQASTVDLTADLQVFRPSNVKNKTTLKQSQSPLGRYYRAWKSKLEEKKSTLHSPEGRIRLKSTTNDKHE